MIQMVMMKMITAMLCWAQFFPKLVFYECNASVARLHTL